jgi:hypothetical protein
MALSIVDVNRKRLVRVAGYCLAVALLLLLCVCYIISRSYPYVASDTLINLKFIQPKEQPLLHNEHAIAGRKKAASLTVTFLGLAKNSGSSLPNVLRQLDQLSWSFKSSQALFIVGSSEDDTYELIKQYQKKSLHNRTIATGSFHYEDDVAIRHGLPHLKTREGRIASVRNYALQELSKLPATDFVIMIDMDIIGFNVPGVLDSFGRLPSWDVMCANGIVLYGIYRDVFALRTKTIQYTNHHVWHHDQSENVNITEAEIAMNRVRYETEKMKARDIMDSKKYTGKSRQPIEVESCFSGMAIYKRDVIFKIHNSNDTNLAGRNQSTPIYPNCRYHFRHDTAPYLVDCEHIFFHQCLREKNEARIFTNPQQKLWYGHSGVWKGVKAAIQLRGTNSNNNNYHCHHSNQSSCVGSRKSNQTRSHHNPRRKNSSTSTSQGIAKHNSVSKVK